MAEDPRLPVRADHRFIGQLFSSVLGGKVEEVPDEFDMLGKAFELAGGSWVRIFQGSPKDTVLLKQLIQAAFKRGLLTKKRNWDGKTQGQSVSQPVG